MRKEHLTTMTNDTIEDLQLPLEETPAAPANYRSVLEMWDKVLEPVFSSALEKPQPGWATGMVRRHVGLTLASTVQLHELFHTRVKELKQILSQAIEAHPDALTVKSADQDLDDNFEIYKQLLMDWQLQYVTWEHTVDLTSDGAAVQIAALSELHTMFFSETGVVAHLSSIGFDQVFTEEHQAELAQALINRAQEINAQEKS